MARMTREAARLSLERLYADVSPTAQPFFAAHGFEVTRENLVTLRGETLAVRELG